MSNTQDKLHKSDNIFWVNNPSILITNYLNFTPNKDMTEIQLYNSITRFCIYFLILVIVFQQSYYFIYIILSCILIIIFMYYIKKVNIKYTVNEKINNNNVNQDNSDIIETFNDTDSISYNIGNFDNISHQFDLNDNENIIRNNEIQLTKPTKTVEVGYYDSADKLQFKRTTSEIDDNNLGTPSDLTYTCRKPTADNPFMNPDINDYTSDHPPAACNDDDGNIPKNINSSFNEDLFMNLDDAAEKKNSQRQFYTIPNTSIPNNQTEFAEWLYKSPSTCKESQEKCLRYEDLRFKR